MSEFLTQLERRAALCGIDTGTEVRSRQVSSWAAEFPDDSAAVRALEDCQGWPKFEDLRAAYSRHKRSLAEKLSPAATGYQCQRCLGRGTITAELHDENGTRMQPTTYRCHCPEGQRYGFMTKAPDGMGAMHHDDAPSTSTEFQRQAALAYITQSYGIDPEPIAMVSRILAGDVPDSTLRSLVRKSGQRRALQPPRFRAEPARESCQAGSDDSTHVPAISTPQRAAFMLDDMGGVEL